MSRARIIEHYIEKTKEPGFQITQIRKELNAKNIPEEEIRLIVKTVDDELQSSTLTKSSNKRLNEFIIAGIVMMVFGAGITIGSFTGFLNIGNSFLVVYGPFFSGLSLATGGIVKRKQVLKSYSEFSKNLIE